MKFLIFLTFICLMFFYVNSLEDPTEDKFFGQLAKYSPAGGFGDSCVIDNVKIPNGESAPAPSGNCLLYSCSLKSGEQTIRAVTCPEYAFDPNNCFATHVDLSLQYPYCCPQIICTNE